MGSILIRKLKPGEIPEAIELVRRVFSEYEAPDYTKEGAAEFYKSISDTAWISRLCFYGAFLDNELAGIAATRTNGTHIALLFVEGKYHRMGIGSSLFEAIKSDCTGDKITVNSSPYAVLVYHKLGFVDIEKEQSVNGLRFTPMEFIL